MGRPKKDAKYLNVYIERSIYDEFEEICKELGQSKTVATERALLGYMQDIRKKNNTDEIETAKYSEEGERR